MITTTPSDDDEVPRPQDRLNAALSEALETGHPLDAAALSAAERRHLADTLLVHSLLQQVEQPDHTVQEQRITRVMAAITQDQPLLTPTPTAINPQPRRRWRAPLAIAAAVVLAAAFLRGPFNPRQSATAAVTQAQQTAATGTDRLYQVITQLVLPFGGERELRGELWVHGRSQYLLRQQAALGDIYFGSDGAESWISPPVGPVFVSKRGGAFDQKLIGDRVTAPFLQITSILDRLADRYELTLLPEEDLPSVDGKHQLRCTRVIGRKQVQDSELTPDVIELWTARESGEVQRLELRWESPADEQGLRLMTFQLQPLADPLPTDWYAHQSHHAADRRIIERLEEAPAGNEQEKPTL